MGTMQSKIKELPPVMPGTLYCMQCRSRHLRLTRLRPRDIGHLLLFTFPVRCRRCGQRQYVAPLAAFLSSALPKSKGKRRTRVSWANWTETLAEHAALARPVTTAELEHGTAAGPQPVRAKQPQDELW